jgi:sialidase-1
MLMYQTIHLFFGILLFLSILNTTATATATATANATATATAPSLIFAAGESGYVAFRIPGIVVLTDHSLLAVGEGRKYGCSDFAGQHDIVSKKSTNGGKTWSKLSIVADPSVLFSCSSHGVRPVGKCQFW